MPETVHDHELRGWAASIIVPIGPEGGAGQRAGLEDLVPAETVAELKGRDMMVGRFAELLGLST